MKIKFEELLSIAGKKSNLTGDQLSQRLIQMFCVPGVKKAKQVKGMSEVIFTLLDFNDYYSFVQPPGG
jgi:hypothetical protein